jgi:hypothetical protein
MPQNIRDRLFLGPWFLSRILLYAVDRAREDHLSLPLASHAAMPCGSSSPPDQTTQHGVDSRQVFGKLLMGLDTSQAAYLGLR